MEKGRLPGGKLLTRQEMIAAREASRVAGERELSIHLMILLGRRTTVEVSADTIEQVKHALQTVVGEGHIDEMREHSQPTALTMLAQLLREAEQ